MWYGDPRDARRAARYARRANRYRYGRPGGGIIGLLFFIFLILAIFTHFWAWIIPGIILLAVMFWLLRRSMPGAWFTGYQQPPQNQQPQQPYYQPPPEQPYQPYEQGYQAPQESYQEGGQQYQYPPQTSQPVDQQQRYEEPQAQHPEQMPPMHMFGHARPHMPQLFGSFMLSTQTPPQPMPRRFGMLLKRTSARQPPPPNRKSSSISRQCVSSIVRDLASWSAQKNWPSAMEPGWSSPICSPPRET